MGPRAALRALLRPVLGPAPSGRSRPADAILGGALIRRLADALVGLVPKNRSGNNASVR
jgi:hypothetical protein